MRAILLGLSLLVLACGAPTPRPDSTSWLEGRWSDGEVMELWVADGSVLYGASLSPAGTELLRFDGDTLLAAPPGVAPVSFSVRSRSATSFEVHRAGHDPEWIRYVREDDTLVATIGVAGETRGRWRFSPAPSEGPDLAFFGPVDVSVERRGDDVWLALPPCLCSPSMRCVGVREGGRLVLFASVSDSMCEACEAASVRCDVAPGLDPSEVTLGGRPLVRSGEAFRGTGLMLMPPHR